MYHLSQSNNWEILGDDQRHSTGHGDWRGGAGHGAVGYRECLTGLGQSNQGFCHLVAKLHR